MLDRDVAIPLILVVTTGFCGCESKDALLSFSTSGCKSQALLLDDGAEGISRSSIGNIPSTSDPPCFAWEIQTDVLVISVYDIVARCGVEYKGEAEVKESNAVNLFANREPDEDGLCVSGACDCAYDWRYEVTGVDLARKCTIHLEIGSPCDGDDVRYYEVEIPLSSQQSGQVCL